MTLSTTRERLSDPGGESSNAPVGSVQWAQRWRLEVEYICRNVPREPERLALYWRIGEQYEVWRLLNRPDGSTFESLEELCEERGPWGFGHSLTTIKAWMAIFERRPLERVPSADIRYAIERGVEAIVHLRCQLQNARQTKATEAQLYQAQRAFDALHAARSRWDERELIETVNALAADEPERPRHPPIEVGLPPKES